MFDILIAFMAFAIVALGVGFYIKLQRAMGGTHDKDAVRRKQLSPLPRELRELQIEQPQENVFDRPNQLMGNPKGQQDPSSNSAS